MIRWEKDGSSARRPRWLRALVVAAVLGIAAAPSAAGAQAPPEYFLETSHSVGECGVATITLRNVSPWVYGVTVLLDGAQYAGTDYNLTVNNGTPASPGPTDSDSSRSLDIPVPDDSGTHTIEYRVAYGSENSLYLGLPVGTPTSFTFDACVTEVETTTPTTEPDDPDEPDDGDTTVDDEDDGDVLAGGETPVDRAAAEQGAPGQPALALTGDSTTGTALAGLALVMLGAGFVTITTAARRVATPTSRPGRHLR